MAMSKEQRAAEKAAWAAVDLILEEGGGEDSPEYRAAWANLERAIKDRDSDRLMVALGLRRAHNA